MEKEGFEEKTVHLSEGTRRKLDGTAREMATTLSTLLQAVWATLISRLSGDGDVVFGNVVSGRPAQVTGVDSMVGMFINTLPVRVETTGKNFRDILSSLTALQAEREEHEYAPLRQIQGKTSIPAGSPLFETLFVYENYPIDEHLKKEGQHSFRITHSEGIEAAHYPLTLAVLPDGDLTLKLSYDRQRYDEQCADSTWFRGGHIWRTTECGRCIQAILAGAPSGYDAGSPAKVEGGRVGRSDSAS